MPNRFANTLYSGLLAACALSFSAAASAKQCIWNKGAFELHVAWYRPATLVLTTGDAEPSIRALTQPAQSGSFWLGRGMCNETDELLTAVVSVNSALIGQHELGKIRVVDAGVLISNRGAHGAIGTAQAVRARHGADIDVLNAKPFLVTTPSTSRYLDFWGTVFEPAFGPGGPLN